MSHALHDRTFAVLLGLATVDVAVLDSVVLPLLLGPPQQRATGRPALSTAPASPSVRSVTPEAPPLEASADEPEVNPAAPQQPAPAGPQPQAVVSFSSGSWWIHPDDRASLSQMAERWRGGSATIEVHGHADPPGTTALNERISRARAQAVAEVLTAHGVEQARIVTRAFGERVPSAAGGDRRVELFLREAR
jgi:outer membrane protein OmpA-like peptidoglycan-associated protein